MTKTIKELKSTEILDAMEMHLKSIREGEGHCVMISKSGGEESPASILCHAGVKETWQFFHTFCRMMSDEDFELFTNCVSHAMTKSDPNAKKLPSYDPTT